MDRTNVLSKSITSIGHDGKDLEVQFANGHIYTYEDVPYDVYQKLRIAPSIGSSMSSLVIKGGYQFKKLV